MNKMRLVISEIEQYRRPFPVWSVIYVILSDKTFPDDTWWDASSSLLTYWSLSLIRLLCNSQTTCDLPFMDGDYEIRLTKLDEKKANAVFLASDEKIILSEEIDLLFFVRQILRAIEKIKQATEASILSSQELQEMSVAASKLRTMLSQKK